VLTNGIFSIFICNIGFDEAIDGHPLEATLVGLLTGLSKQLKCPVSITPIAGLPLVRRDRTLG
jgi:hypothetical protein